MPARIVNPGEPSIEKVEHKLPSLPRSEAHRIRRASRSFLDSLLPAAMRNLAEALESEDAEERRWATDKVLKGTLAAIPNETVDPESVVVDGSVKVQDGLKELEEMTSQGTGLPDE
jgi:hypothetical protein